MDWQTPVTAVIVAASSAYAVWALLPRQLRDACLARWCGVPPAAASGDAACGGGCSGCSAGAAAPAPGAAQPIRIVRMPRAGG